MCLSKRYSYSRSIVLHEHFCIYTFVWTPLGNVITDASVSPNAIKDLCEKKMILIQGTHHAVETAVFPLY